jgi:thymidylate synthase (FAD)
MMMGTQTDQVKLVSVTPDAEKHMAYCARVSNPNNQENEKFSGLLKYCIKHQHWSIFEQATMTLEINTTRGIAAQILRHRSFTYQEFSQRYADSSLLADDIPLPELRRQDTKNRQNSIDDIDPFTRQRYEILIQKHFHLRKRILDPNMKQRLLADSPHQWGAEQLGVAV